MELKNTTINFLGDSITEGYNVLDKNNIYVNRLVRQYGIIANNYGVYGTYIARQQVELNGESFAVRYQKMRPADVTVVFGGTNDYGHGVAPFGEIYDNTKDTFFGALRVMISGLVTLNPKQKILVVTPMRRNNDETKLSANNKYLIDYVDAIIAVSKMYGVELLDFYRQLPINPNLVKDRKLYCLDGLHPNDEGHKIIAEFLGKKLESL